MLMARCGLGTFPGINMCPCSLSGWGQVSGHRIPEKCPRAIGVRTCDFDEETGKAITGAGGQED